MDDLHQELLSRALTSPHLTKLRIEGAAAGPSGSPVEIGNLT
jgi:hypothetical protein